VEILKFTKDIYFGQVVELTICHLGIFTKTSESWKWWYRWRKFHHN